jgi:outer membrane protein assembly factor BamB
MNAIAARASFAVLMVIGSSVSAADSLGWRGDGSGQYPDATPPLTWGRISKACTSLHFQIQKPAEKDVGTPMPDGVAREWLVLGPYTPPEPKPFEGDSLPNELQLAPVEGDKVGELIWKKSPKLENSFVDLNAILGKQAKGIGYAFTNIYTDVAGDYLINLTIPSQFRIVVNGVAAKGVGTRAHATFVKGWNRVLFKADATEHSWFVEPIFYPVPADCTESNIAWHTALPGFDSDGFGQVGGVGMPVTVGDKIFVLCEPHDLVCLRKSDGKVLWVRTNSYFDAIPEAERAANPAIAALAPTAEKLSALMDTLKEGAFDKAKCDLRNKLQGELYSGLQKAEPKKYKLPGGQDVGYAGNSPVSDGKHVYIWLLSGVSACYDLDGKREWIRLENKPGIEHGFSSTPFLIGGKLITYMRELMARDAKTGEIAWRFQVSKFLEGESVQGHFHGSFTKATLGGQEYLVVPNGTLVRTSDGKVVFSDVRVTGFQHIPSAVMNGRTMVWLNTQSMLHLVTFPDKADETLVPESVRTLHIDTNAFPRFYNDWHMASPLIHDGLAYLMDSVGVLTVVDLAESKILYQRQLDLDCYVTHAEGACRGMGCSPTLAGKYIYFVGSSNTVLVIEPGRTYKQVAKNRIERRYLEWGWSARQERTVACPVFDGKRMFLRAESGLYAIEGK